MIIIILEMINRFTTYEIKEKSFSKLAMVVTVAAQVNLIMLISELFKEFYPTMVMWGERLRCSSLRWIASPQQLPKKAIV